MQRLLIFIFAYRNVFIFTLLQIFSLWLLVQFNNNQSKVFNEIALNVTGVFQGWNAWWVSYFNLTEKNQNLLYENIQLRKQLIQLNSENSSLRFIHGDSIQFIKSDYFYPDSLLYDFIPCRAIYNTYSTNFNYLILNVGSNDGVKEKTGVVSQTGVVGFVTKVSANYALAISLLNKNYQLNAKIASNNVNALFQWQGNDPGIGNLLYVPLHYNIKVGDTILTSSNSTVFPEGYLIGTIQHFEGNQPDGFYKIQVKINTDFRKLDYLYLINFKHQAELDSLIISAK